MEEDNLTSQQFKSLLADTLQILQTPESNLRSEDYDTLESAIRSIDFFQMYLEAPANLHDFSQLLKFHLKYEVHPHGVALMKEGEYMDNFYLILKGNVQKLQPRSYNEIELELRQQDQTSHRKEKKKKIANTNIEPENQPQKVVPRYLQHTSTTKKKFAGTKAEKHQALLNKILNETAELKSKKAGDVHTKNRIPGDTKEKINFRLTKLNLEAGEESPNKSSQSPVKKSNADHPLSNSNSSSPTKKTHKEEVESLNQEKQNNLNQTEQTSSPYLKEETLKELNMNGKIDNEDKGIENETETNRITEEHELIEEGQGGVVEKTPKLNENDNDNNNQKEEEEELTKVTEEKIEEEEIKGKPQQKKKIRIKSLNEDLEKTKDDKKGNIDQEEHKINEEEIDPEFEEEESEEEPGFSKDQNKNIKPLHGMTEEEVDFIKQVVLKNPEIENRCFLGEILRVKTDKIYNVGDYFGVNFFRRIRPKEGSIIAVLSEEVHFLVITRQAYELVMEEIEKKSQEKAMFFMDLFPFFDPLIIKKFSYNFSEREFKKNETIYSQDQPVQDLYLLKSGDVRLFKEVEASPQELEHSSSRSYLLNSKTSGRIGLPIAVIMKHQFFGDEVLIKHEKRRYTAVPIGANASTYFLKTNILNKIRGVFADLLQILGKQTKEKFAWRDQRAAELLERRRENLKSIVSTQEKFETMDPGNALRFQLGTRWRNDSDIKTRRSNSTLKMNVIPAERLSNKRDNSNERNLDRKSSLEGFNIQKRTDYSREAKIADKLVDGKYLKRMVEESYKLTSRGSYTNSFIEFNIMKDLQDKPSTRTKFPTVNLNKSSSPVKASQTAREASLQRKSPEPDPDRSPVIKKLLIRLGSLDFGAFTKRYYDEITEDKIDRKLREVINQSSSHPLVSSSLFSEMSLENSPRILDKSSNEVIDGAKNLKLLKNRAIHHTKSTKQFKIHVNEERKERKNIKFTFILGKKMKFTQK